MAWAGVVPHDIKPGASVDALSGELAAAYFDAAGAGAAAAGAAPKYWA